MTCLLHTLLLVAFVAVSRAGAGGDSSGDLCDVCGGSATYKESIVTKDNTKLRTIKTTGCPNHVSYCTGKSKLDGCGKRGEPGTITEAREYAGQGKRTNSDDEFQLLAEPVLRPSPLNIKCDMGAIGLALNGVSIYGPAVDSDCDIVDVTEEKSEWSSFDYCGGHAAPSGDYHYHFVPSCLTKPATDTHTSVEPGTQDEWHGPQIGWMFDGFPIYSAEKGPGGGPILPCGTAGAHAENCLDDCNGLEKVLPDVDDYKYRYYFVGPLSDLESYPVDPKPAASVGGKFAPWCLKGCRFDEYNDGTCTGTAGSGTVDDFEAEPKTGYTDVYAAPGAATCVPSENADKPGKSSQSSAPKAWILAPIVLVVLQFL